jgi:two-component system, cell cycle sensor histidine kinase and response regulator CckA
MSAASENQGQGVGPSALEDSQDLLRYIIKHDSSAVALLDRELNYLAVSDRFLDDYGIPDDDIIGKNHYDVFPDLPEVWKEAHRSALMGQTVKNEDDWYEHADGSILHNRWECRPWYRSDGTIGGIVLYTEVTTEQKEAEEALLQSEGRYRQLFELESDAILLVDAETGQILEANSAACSLYGYSRAEWLSMKNTDISLEPDETRAAARHGQTWVPARRHHSKDGTEILVEITASHFELRGRHTILAAMRDVTEREAATQALRSSEEQLRQAQKMDAIGQLAGGIAHDFNNLLTTIMGYSELILASSCDRPEEVRADVQEIRQAAERAKDLTSQILAFSRRQPQKPEIVSPNALIEETEQLLRRTLGENIEFVISLDPEAASVEVDPGQFMQVIANLAVNARDAMPSGGKLTISTGNVVLDDEFCRVYPDCVPGPYVMVEVADTGRGIDEETLKRVFEPFFTTKGQGAGTGLGLSTVHGIVKQSGGHIFVDSEPGVGSSFKICLPPAGSQTVAATQPETPAVAEAPKGETILVVEDQDSVRALVKRVLEREGYEVIAVSDGDQGLKIIQGGTDVDLLLTDIVLPGFTQGDTLGERALELRPGLPLLFMSGYLRNASIAAERFDAAVGFLQKPFAPDVLCSKVREALQEDSHPT